MMMGDCGTARELPSQAICGSNESLKLFSISLRESTVVLCSLGASIQSWKHGDDLDIVLGYKDAATMHQSKNPVYFSSIVGRVANRIAKGKFCLGEGMTYALEVNDAPNHLHGGGMSGGFSHKIWSGKICSVCGGQGIQFSLTSVDGDQGFPGTVQVTATYSLRPSLSSSGVVLRLEMEAQLIGDKPSPINLAQHSYLNLAGHLPQDGDVVNGGILGHTLRVYADAYTPVDETAIPTRKVQSLNDDPVMDWREERNLREALHQYGMGKMSLSADEVQADLSSRTPSIGPYGFDHNYVVRKQPATSIPKVAELSYQNRKLTVYSTAPGVQLYTSNYLSSSSENASICKSTYQAWSGVCLETQHFPDSIIESGHKSNLDAAFAAGKCPIMTPENPHYSHSIDYCFEHDKEHAAAETCGSDTLSQKYASIEDMWKNQDLSTWYKRAKEYYEDNCAATIEGVLGGIGWISDTDLNGSREFLKGITLPKTDGPSVACECGAGIGRVTKGLLFDFCQRSDLVESSERLLFASPEYIGNQASKCRFFATELQEWEPPKKKYSIVWIQWVLCYLTDDDIVKFLKRCGDSLVDGGIIVMKENTCADSAFVLDVDDASATRSVPYWLDLIFKAGLKVTHHKMQDDFPDDIFPVPMFALQPVSQSL